MNESNFVQEVILPSKGLLNPEIPEGKLVQRCMMVADQKFLSGSNLPAGTALQQLLQRTITSPAEFNVANLTLSDTLFLLFKLRILSYGNNYSFRSRCPECGQRITINLNLPELPVEMLDEDYQERLIVELPHRGDTVYTRLLTNKDMEDIEKELKRRRRKNEDEVDYVLRIMQSIEKIELKTPNKDGKSVLTHPLDIEKYINSLTDLDARAINATRDSIRYGITPTVEYICPECGEYIDVNVQFSGDFFRPQFN